MQVHIVADPELSLIVKELSTESFLGFDTETTGLERSDRPFGLSLATYDKTYYVDLHYKNAGPLLQEVFTGKTYFAHNAKFDAMMLYMGLGIEIKGKLHCTALVERILRNDRMSYSLEAVAKVYGLEKDMRVEEYIKEHDLYEYREFMGEKRKVPQFQKVPLELLSEYAGQDARLAFQIGMKQREQLEKLSRE